MRLDSWGSVPRSLNNGTHGRFLNFYVMGKSTGLFAGVVRRKTANLVGFKVTNSNSKEKQGWREYVAKISNPRSYAQSKQRAKIRPAAIFYQAFQQVENHAFLPTKRASLNRQKFMSFAMSMQEISDVRKGDVAIPFIDYRISQGSLGCDSLTKGAYTAEANEVRFAGLKAGAINASAMRTTSVADFATGILTNTPQLREGMELTFLAVLGNIETLERQAVIFSVVLDKSNRVTTMGNLLPGLLAFRSSADGLDVSAADGASYNVLSAGVIISARRGKTWDYTNSYMARSAYAVDGFDWDAESVIASYMDGAAAAESDLQLQQADNTTDSSISQVSIDTAEVRHADGTILLNSQTVAVVAMSDGTRKIIVDNAGVPYGGTAESGTYYLLGTSANSTPVALSNTTLAGSPTINAAAVTLNATFATTAVRPVQP